MNYTYFQTRAKPWNSQVCGMEHSLIRNEPGRKFTLFNMKFGYKETFCKEKEHLKPDLPTQWRWKCYFFPHLSSLTIALQYIRMPSFPSQTASLGSKTYLNKMAHVPEDLSSTQWHSHTSCSSTLFSFTGTRHGSAMSLSVPSSSYMAHHQVRDSLQACELITEYNRCMTLAGLSAHQ